MKQFEYCVCIGRFQPFHCGQSELIKEALELANTVLIVIGSANKAPNIQDPWSVSQRKEMILSALSDEEKACVKFLPVRDYLYTNNKWLTEVQSLVYSITDGLEDNKTCNLGDVSFFPQWKFHKMRSLDRMPSASIIRGLYFTHDIAYKAHVHPNVAQYLEEFKTTESFKNLKEEYDFIKRYKEAWSGAPFKPTFVTTDAIVARSGHILLVRRKGNPGKGLLALPGGFLNQNETAQDGAIRELKEETSIKLSKEELHKAVVDQKVFDLPNRSLRERTVTIAFLLDLKSGPLIQVKGGDDASHAFWMSLSELESRESEFFEDHFHIISHFVSKF